ncbi:hypothetical protein BY458DRAFT_530597 [Sporodiniella umbellata]|nr:hypothetical protein BY458DRAFT_530597 [Sporodiniella umbellata]
MATFQSILEQLPYKRHFHRKWYLAFIAFGTITVTFYLVYFTHFNNLKLESKQADVYENTSSRNISFHVPTQKDLYYIDLDKYPVEDNMLALFSGTEKVIKAVTINKLLQKNIPWTEQYLDQKTIPDADTYACPVQTIPYPILREITDQYTPLNDTDSFFEDSSINMTKPFVLLPYAEPPIFSEGDKLCIRIVVPYRASNEDDPHNNMYRPYPKNSRDITYPWWDTTMAWLQEVQTNTTIPFLMQPWYGHRLLRMNSRRLNNINTNLPEWARLREDELYERTRIHIYEAQLVLPRAGKYKLSALLEFTEAKYNFEFGPVTPYNPTELPILPSGSDIIVVGDNREENEERLAETLFQEHLELPLCKGSDHSGRWLPWPKAYRKSNNVLSLSHAQKYWAPYDCRYRYVSYEEFNRCVSHKYSRGMDMYGDSNIRRSLKKFISHGQWCKDWQAFIEPATDKTIDKRQANTPPPAQNTPLVDPGYSSPKQYKHLVSEQTRNCYCEDYSEAYWKPEWFDPVQRRVNVSMNNTLKESNSLGDTEWDNTDIRKTNPMDSYKISSYKWDGLTYLNNPSWDTAVAGNTVATDVAVFSIGNWDAAFLELEPYLKDVDRLIQQIKSHYDLRKTRIIYRTPQYYCCRIDRSSRVRQVSGPRLDLFDIEVKTKFVRELNATVWDTKALGEARTWEEKLEAVNCPSNHVPADMVDIENQIFMNGLCNSFDQQ